MHNLGYYLENGKGIKKDKKESINYYLKALEKGHLDAGAKEEVDEYYDENQEFREAHPNYKKWN